MSLSKPSPRGLIHDRTIHCQGFKREDGLWDIEGRLIDTKSYSFSNTDRGGINSGEPIHDMRIRVTLNDDLVIQEAEAGFNAGPFGICPAIAEVVSTLKGLRISAGWRKDVLERMGRTRGCTHLTELLLGPVATTAFQTIYSGRGTDKTSKTDTTKPSILDTCHALRSDGPVVEQIWPEFYTGSGEKEK